MAITQASLTSGSSATNGTSYATASVSPTGNRLIVYAVYGQALTAANAASPTGVSGAGLTFVKWVETNNTSNGQSLSLWYAMDPTPSTGAITATFTNTQADCVWSVYELAGLEVGSNGANAVNTNTATAAASATSATATLAAFASTDNGAVSATIWAAAGAAATCTPDTGWSEIHDLGVAEGGAGFSLETQWRADNDTTALGTWSATGSVRTVAAEIIAATATIHYQRVIGGGGNRVIGP